LVLLQKKIVTIHGHMNVKFGLIKVLLPVRSKTPNGKK